jgi:hypothetical protein
VQPKGRKRRSRFNTKVNVYVAVRHDGEWQFAAFHNTRYHWLMNALTARTFDPSAQVQPPR